MNLPTTRFVLLRHEMPAGHDRPSHWDLLLEQDGAAWTWELLDLPIAWSPDGVAGPLVAIRLADHRLHYLDYEGPVSGDRGRVTQSASGSCRWLGIQQSALRAQLTSPDWSTQIELVDLEANDRWQLNILRDAEL